MGRSFYEAVGGRYFLSDKNVVFKCPKGIENENRLEACTVSADVLRMSAVIHRIKSS